MSADRFRGLLLDRRARVVAALDHLHADHAGTLEDEAGDEAYDQHIGDVATTTLDREIDYSLEENSEQVLAAIDAALARLDDGTFGVCERCGGPIAEERLEARPYATKCIECKRREERG